MIFLRIFSITTKELDGFVHRAVLRPVKHEPRLFLHEQLALKFKQLGKQWRSCSVLFIFHEAVDRRTSDVRARHELILWSKKQRT